MRRVCRAGISPGICWPARPSPSPPPSEANAGHLPEDRGSFNQKYLERRGLRRRLLGGGPQALRLRGPLHHDEQRHPGPHAQGRLQHAHARSSASRCPIPTTATTILPSIRESVRTEAGRVRRRLARRGGPHQQHDRGPEPRRQRPRPGGRATRS
ncbi:MAG: hypothetical protein MZV64_18365 [Ignavibacteriales bacterium]|nr:hypothetical protein [Ignavibacteriales bacterium]